MTSSITSNLFVFVCVKEPDIKTFEWPPFSMKAAGSNAARRGSESHFNGITAGTTTGEILLINTENNRMAYE